MKSGLLENLKLSFVCFMATLALAACIEEKKDEKDVESPSTEEPAAPPEPSGTYKTSCVAISGAAFTNETHYRYEFTFGAGGVANEYEFLKAYYTDSGCTTRSYSSLQEGIFLIGNETTTPSNGYQIMLTTPSASVVGWTSTSSNALASGCSSGFSAWQTQSANIKYANITGDVSCAGITAKAAGTDFYNVGVFSGNTINMGAPLNDNPGVLTQGGIPNSAPIVFTK